MHRTKSSEISLSQMFMNPKRIIVIVATIDNSAPGKVASKRGLVVGHQYRSEF
jgi:hypothetical protein